MNEARWWLAVLVAATVVAIVVAMVFGLGWWAWSGAAPAPNAARSGSSASAASPEAATEASTHTGGASTPRPGPASRARRPTVDAVPLMQAFAQSTSLRAFIDEALKRPGDGGLLLAMAAYEFCFGELVDARGLAIDQASLTAVVSRESAAKLQARCDLSDQERIDTWTAMLHARQDPFAEDPFLRVVSGANVLADRDPAAVARRHRELVAGLLDTQNIVAMYTLLARSTAVTDGSLPRSYVFDGQPYLDDASQRRLQDAYLAVSCDYGLACGAESVASLRLCAERGWCGADVRTALRAGYAGLGAEHDFETLSRRLLDALRQRRIEAFVPAARP